MYSNLNCVIVVVFNYTCVYTRDYIIIYLLHNRYNDKILLFIIVVVVVVVVYLYILLPPLNFKEICIFFFTLRACLGNCNRQCNVIVIPMV